MKIYQFRKFTFNVKNHEVTCDGKMMAEIATTDSARVMQGDGLTLIFYHYFPEKAAVMKDGQFVDWARLKR
ncbi:hypothetical protein [Pantoea sp. GbtcB22]|uniref:hypothetical protein n=1 Tax=Pantoea sp. GbtcB22 TaxID=2824767 RepID=UPI001C3043FF|nr:hypothetical protein [Pantoea sp. GbtcB22]